MTISQDRLYSLLPAIYRIRDADQGNQLRALFRVIEEQADILENDIAQLYDNWFIETCEDWVVPYIGDLIGYLPLQDTGGPGNTLTQRDIQRNRILIPRRDVAKTIWYRRRKGTLYLLEILADDVADWPGRAVEFYRLLAWTQAINHQHLLRGCTTDIRDGNLLDSIDGPFDSVSHTVDVRRINSRHRRGRYNIPNASVFVCRLKSYSVTKTPAFCVDNSSPYDYTFSVLGNDTPLFIKPVELTSLQQIAQETNLPVQIRRRAFKQRDMTANGEVSRASDAYYGAGKSIAIEVPDWPTKGAPQPVPADLVIPANLSKWTYIVPKNHVAVDPVLGRIRFPATQTPKKGVIVSYNYGFSADIGGGEYPRPISGPDLQAISLLRCSDLKNPKQFAVMLSAADSKKDSLAAYINANLSPQTKELQKKPDSAELSSSLVGDLNAILADPVLCDYISSENAATVPESVMALCSQKMDSIFTLRRNRLLLESIYPEFIPESYPVYYVGDTEKYKKITEALVSWQKEKPPHAAIEITDSGVYTEQISIHLEAGQGLYFRAAENTRPVLRQLNWQTSMPDAISISGGQGSRIVFDGLLITGRGITISGPDLDQTTADDDLCEVIIRHCTLVPGWSVDSESSPVHTNEPSIELTNTRSQIRIYKSIIGSILVLADDIKSEPNCIRIYDSILDATGENLDAISAEEGHIAHAVLTFVRCTIFGKVLVQEIKTAEDCIFTGKVTVARSQAGCMRFCFVPPGSRTSRTFSCLPGCLTNQPGMSDDEKESIRARLRPLFTSTKYGTPGYCQLAARCAREIRHGADDESEMGVFHDLYQPQREKNLQLRLDEYTPTSMKTGIIFVN